MSHSAGPDSASRKEELMDTGDGKRNDRFFIKQPCFKLPPHIEQSIFRSNAPVNVPSLTRSVSLTRDNRSTTHMNDSSGGGSKQKQSHVPRSRSVTRKSPGRRKSSNSVSLKKGQGSTELNSERAQSNGTNTDSNR